MTTLVQITDTHIVERGTLLYGQADTARYLAESVAEINNFHPLPDAVLITGDLVEHPGPVTYSHFADLIEPLKPPVYLMPGNHDDLPYDGHRTRRHSHGVAEVLSTISGTPCAWAMSASASRSTMLPAGLPMDSQNTAVVLSSISFAIASALSSSAKRTSIPWRGSMCLNSV